MMSFQVKAVFTLAFLLSCSLSDVSRASIRRLRQAYRPPPRTIEEEEEVVVVW